MIQAIGLTSHPHRKLPPAVEDVSFEANQGQVTALLGGPRSGRTTTLRLLLGLQSGRGIAYFRGRPLHGFDQPAREVGALLGDVPGHPSRSVRGHLRMLSAAVGAPTRRADDVLDVVGLAALAEEPLGRLSRGMDRRLGIAVALLGDPHTLVLDEPVANLSARESQWMHGLLRAHAAQGGTVLFTTADAKEAARAADRVVVLERGRVIADQSAADFARTRLRPRVTVRSPYAARLGALLVKEARVAHQSVEVVREDGNSLSVYGSSCAGIGDLAHRHGILIHQLADEFGDMGPRAHMGRSVSDAPAPLREALQIRDPRTGGPAEPDGPANPGGTVDAGGVTEPAKDHQLGRETRRLEGGEASGGTGTSDLVSSAQAVGGSGTRNDREATSDVTSLEMTVPELTVRDVTSTDAATMTPGAPDRPAADSNVDRTTASAKYVPGHAASETETETEVGTRTGARAAASTGKDEALPYEALDRQSPPDSNSEPPLLSTVGASPPSSAKRPAWKATSGPRRRTSPGDDVHDDASLANGRSGRWRSARAVALSQLPPPLAYRPGCIPVRVLSYEWRRVTGVGTGYVTVGVVLFVSAVISLFLARSGHTPQHRVLAAWPREVPLPPAAFGAAFLGAVAFGDEFKYPGLAAERARVPCRLSLLGAKFLVTGGIAVLLALLAIGCDAALLQLVYGQGSALLPQEWPSLLAGWLGVVIGCAWAGLLAAGVFRSRTAGVAAVVGVAVLLVPLLERVMDGPSARTAAGFPSRLRGLVLWPFGAERYLAATVRVVTQPVGIALLLALFTFSCAYVWTSLRSRAQ